MHEAGHDSESICTLQGNSPPEEFAHPHQEARSSLAYPLPALGETMLLKPTLSEKVVYSRKVEASLIWEHRIWEIGISQVC